MNDDWRLRITLLEHDHADTLAGSLAATVLEHDLVESLHDRVIVSRDGAEIFCYAGARDQAEGAEAQIRSLAAEHGWEPVYELMRWHPTAEEWEDPDKSLPATEGERTEERAERMEHERDESRERGYPEYEVRIECRSHGDATELESKLNSEGVPNARRWKFLLVGALDEDSANALAARLRQEAPEGSKVTVEGSLGAALSGAPVSPFAVFGGLGG